MVSALILVQYMHNVRNCIIYCIVRRCFQASPSVSWVCLCVVRLIWLVLIWWYKALRACSISSIRGYCCICRSIRLSVDNWSYMARFHAFSRWKGAISGQFTYCHIAMVKYYLCNWSNYIYLKTFLCDLIVRKMYVFPSLNLAHVSISGVFLSQGLFLSDMLCVNHPQKIIPNLSNIVIEITKNRSSF